jgi:hypothetical protein
MRTIEKSKGGFMETHDKVVPTQSGQFGGLIGRIISIYPEGAHGAECTVQVLFEQNKHYLKAQFPVSQIRPESDNPSNFILF